MRGSIARWRRGNLAVRQHVSARCSAAGCLWTQQRFSSVTGVSDAGGAPESSAANQPPPSLGRTAEELAELAELVVVTESPLESVCIMEMNLPKANVLTSDLMTRLLAAIKEVCDPDAAKRYHGIILTSKVPGVFSGGLDIKELLRNRSKDRFAHNWALFQELFCTLHSLPVPLAVAINGHAAAGGTVVALGADYRVMARTRHDGKPTSIGVAASRYGLAVPPYVAGSLEHAVGFRRAEDLLVNGRMLSADGALSVGLVDEVVESHDEAVVPCLEFMEKVLAMPSPLPFWVVKDAARKKLLAPLCTPALRAADTDSFFDMLQNPTVRANIHKHVTGLTNRRKDERDG